MIPCLMHVGIKHDRGATNLHLLGHPGFEILRMMHRSNAERTLWKAATLIDGTVRYQRPQVKGLS